MLSNNHEVTNECSLITGTEVNGHDKIGENWRSLI